MTRISELIVYREFEQGQLLEDMTWIMDHYDSEYYNLEDVRALYYECVHGLVDLAGTYGFDRNLWHAYLTYLLVNNENVFSTACEIHGPVEGSINELARHDFEIFKELYDCDFGPIEEHLGACCYELISSYRNVNEHSKMFNKRIRDRICDLSVKLGQAGSIEEFTEDMVAFYKDFGVGSWGFTKLSAWFTTRRESILFPLPILPMCIWMIWWVMRLPKKKLVDNTEAFVEGRKANNCLLFGDAGTGKSSSVKAILNQYYDKGLRIIEIYKHQFQDLNDVIAQIKNRNYRFIIYMDDLSFEDFEIEYKYLKAVIEGGLEKKPENILIYATSNRRHLVREKFSDKEERRDDLHASDTVQEKLSLVYRFGVKIFSARQAKKEFQNIVRVLAERYGVTMPEEELLLEANRWELQHGGLSGRTAQQFIDYLLGQVD